MTQPRQVLPNSFYELTRRCSQRQFTLRPDEETNNAFVYCLAEAAQRFGIELLVAQQMSNHHHTVLFDRYGCVIDFTEHFHKMLAKCMNALRGRWENMWSSGSPSLVKLETCSDVIDKMIYAATNPVAAQLVERVDQWPGAKTVRCLVKQEPLVAYRPDFFRSDGRMPETVTLEFVVPPELGDPDEVIAEVRTRIKIVEDEQARKRATTGMRLVGRRGVLRQSWRDSPSTREPRRGLNPRLAARSVSVRIDAIQRNRSFLSAYRFARAAWLAGAPVPFPAGTYWLARFANVPVLDFLN